MRTRPQHRPECGALRISEAEATLKSARLANLPSLAFSPSAGISSFGGERASKTYSLPLQASWQIDLFGKLKNAKMQQKMLVESSKAYRQAVQVNLVANIAREYYNCALLHAQLSLARQSVDVWNETVRTMKAFMEEGQYTDAAVSQAEASREQVKVTAVDLEQQIRESENAMKSFWATVQIPLLWHSMPTVRAAAGVCFRVLRSLWVPTLRRGRASPCRACRCARTCVRPK